MGATPPMQGSMKGSGTRAANAREPGYEDLGSERDARGGTTGCSRGEAADGLDGRDVKAHRVHETNLPGHRDRLRR
jgi:hypothetical protein